MRKSKSWFLSDGIGRNPKEFHNYEYTRETYYPEYTWSYFVYTCRKCLEEMIINDKKLDNREIEEHNKGYNPCLGNN
ncbi:MAG: hypothetical protein NUV86_09605 [Candidatus Scalindua sp.]|nr:hypothetical protein [Candidatus Scalindua sp.]